MKRLFLDIETTGLIPKGAKWETDFMQFPYIVSIAWLNHKNIGSVPIIEKRFNIIKPNGWDIPPESTKIHKITNDFAEKFGCDMMTILWFFISEASKYNSLIAHNIYFDISIIKANIMRGLFIGSSKIQTSTLHQFMEAINKALDKSKRICTMMKTIKFVGAKKGNGSGKFPTLQELHKKLFGFEFEYSHNAERDVLAVEKCYDELVRIGIL